MSSLFVAFNYKTLQLQDNSVLQPYNKSVVLDPRGSGTAIPKTPNLSTPNMLKAG